MDALADQPLGVAGPDVEGQFAPLDFGKHGETVPDFGVSDIRDGKLVLKETIPGKLPA